MNLTAACELWRVVMYGVGVFVTCNAAGWALGAVVRRASGRGKPRPERRKPPIRATPKRKEPFYEDLTRPGAASALPEMWRPEP